MLLKTMGSLLLTLTCWAAAASSARDRDGEIAQSEYGWDEKTQTFTHPRSTPYANYDGPRPMQDSLKYLEKKSYAKNMKVEAHWDLIVRPGHTWQHIVDMNGGRYMFQYYRTRLNVYDITDPKNLKVILNKTYTDGSWFGAASLAFNKELGKWIMLQSFEVPRSIGGMEGHKYSNPNEVARIKNSTGYRGIKVFELLSPTEWKLIAEVSMDGLHPHASKQEGGGAFDVATYIGRRYAYFAGAPDDTFVHMEHPNEVYSPIQMIYDFANPAKPELVSTWWVPGQRLGEEEAYKKWSRHGDRMSWTGARAPLQVPTPVEDGGRYGYTTMGALGFYVVDLSDIKHPKPVGHLELPASLAGNEGDWTDATRAVTRGIVLASGYPVNEDCYEPWKDVYVIDVKNPAAPKIISTLPRPKPAAEAPYKDFCFRRGKFGPKRSPAAYNPGTPNPNITIYPYFNAGLQMFDISDPANPKIVGYFTQPMGGDFSDIHSYNSPTESIHVEWDRNLIWAFTTSGTYLLSSPLLGKPVFTMKQ